MSPPAQVSLPIDGLIPGLLDALLGRRGVVLQAPPGAGKTTRIPIALLREPWLEGQRIIMLEPRRIAARAAAAFMARSLGEKVGETVGYRVRRDTVVGPRTRIEVVTEGVLTRLIQHDAALEGIGLIIFDEFHERSIHADLGLALTLQSQDLLRADLRILVMSATLDGAPIAELLDGAPVITSEGRSFPVELRYRPPRPDTRLEAGVASVVREALLTEEGDVLVFLPGASEIRRVAEHLSTGAPLETARTAGPNVPVRVLPLFGSLSPREQDQAIAPGRSGQRKVVLATSIAETSLTIEGVRTVIDSGLARVPRYSPQSGMSRLVTVRVSRASAEQRRGRAGRLGPGVCYRLWAAHQDHELVPRAVPEILEADLTPLTLELAAAGISDPAELRWLDQPPAPAVTEARALLRSLGALSDGKITAHGLRMAELGLHPRLAHLLLRGKELGVGGTAADLAALLSDRDILKGGDTGQDEDLRSRLELLGSPKVSRDIDRIRDEAKVWRRQLGVRESDRSAYDMGSAGLLLAYAYPDRIAQRRPGQAGRFLLRNGQGASVASPALALADYLVAADLDGQRRESRMYLAAPVSLEDIESHFADSIEVEDRVEWDSARGVVTAQRRRRLGAIILSEAPLREPDPAHVLATLLEGIRREGLAVLPWTDSAQGVRQRAEFLRRLEPDLPDLSDATLERSLEEWLGPHLHGVRRRADLAALDLRQILLGQLSWEQRRSLDDLAPTHFVVPSGSSIAIDYSDPSAPALAVRLQEVFGLPETPRLARGTVPLTLHLLSPARRPVQVTRDLAGFWGGSYFEVRKEMRSRYPKHNWPEDPLKAEATRHTKKRSS
ncbi:MAG: ATP-dependent helicase HrpB [Gemmatimonadota bacterium]